jgi:hypothetical protein
VRRHAGRPDRGRQTLDGAEKGDCLEFDLLRKNRDFFVGWWLTENSLLLLVFLRGVREVVVAKRGKCVVRLWWIAW